MGHHWKRGICYNLCPKEISCLPSWSPICDQDRPQAFEVSIPIRNTKLQRWAIQIGEYGAPIEYHSGRLIVAADTLKNLRDSSTTQVWHPWETDNISYQELYHLQREEFKEQFLEADDASDETRYIVQDGILHTMAPPYPEATPYPRVLLPHEFRERVIDRAHPETAHAAAQKTLMRVQ